MTAAAPVRSSLEAGAVPVVENPYKFLDYFDASSEDQRRFGGRDREIHDIVTRVTNERTLVLFGPSGIGKTSLLLAGVFPGLEERGVRPVYVRTLSSPLADLCHALGGDCGDGESLRQVMARAARDRPVVVVLDQMEELFLRFKPADRESFAEALAAVVRDPSLPVTVVFSLRVDFLGRLDELGRFLPDLLTHRYALQPLTPFGVRQAVTRPLVDAEVAFEPAVVSGLIAGLQEVGFEPVLLQILCTELFKKAAGRAAGGPVRLTVADLERLGGTEEVFRRYVMGVAEALPKERHLLALMVLDSLITEEGTRRAVRLKDLLDFGFAATPDEVCEVADLLAAQRIVRREEREGETWYELIHERLILALREWLYGDREFSQFRQARAYVQNNAAMEVWRENPAALLGAGTLEALLAPYRDHFRFSTRELELVVRSAIQSRSRELAFWAERYGNDRVREMLKDMLSSGREEDRLSAAVSARELAAADGDGRLARACLRVALEDASPAVRREAGLSLARLAREEDLRELRKERLDPAMRSRVYQTYAAMRAGGHELAGVSRFERWQARRRNERRILTETVGTAFRRAWVGAATGALAGLAWGAGHLGLEEGVGWVRDPATYVPRPDLWDSVQNLPFFLLYGALLGWLVAFAAAREAAVRGEGRWLTAVARPSFLLPWLVITIVPNLAESFKWRGSLSVQWGFWVFASLVPLIAMQAGRATVWPGVSRAGAWLAAGVVSLGLPVLLLLVALSALRQGYEPGLFADLPVFCSHLAGCTTLIALLALARSSRYPLGPAVPVSQGRRLASLTVALLALALVPVWFERFYGIDRYLPAILDYDPRQGAAVPWTPSSRRADPPRFEVRNATGKVQLVTWAESLTVEGPVAEPHIEVLPPGRHLSQLTRADDFSGRETVGLVLKPARPSLSERLVSPGSGWSAFRPVPGRTGEWGLHLEGTVDMASLVTLTQRDVRGVEVFVWCEALDSRPGTELRLRAEGFRREVTVPRKVRLPFSFPDPVTHGVSWEVRPDESGRWTLDLRLRETGSAIRPGGASGRREVLVFSQLVL